MTDRFEEISKLTDAMNNLLKVRKSLDTSVLTELDMAILNGCDEFCEAYRDYAVLVLIELVGEKFKALHKVKE